MAGVDRVRDGEIQAEIMREGLITGRRIERQSSSGMRPGLELLPHIVVTVKFEGIARDLTTGRLSLRDPKLVVIRSDKSAAEADTVEAHRGASTCASGSADPPAQRTAGFLSSGLAPPASSILSFLKMTTVSWDCTSSFSRACTVT